MAKEYAKKFYKSKKWNMVRQVVLSEKDYTCERCGRFGNLVHHKIKLTEANINNPLVSLNKDLLEVLCINCHNKEHEHREATRENYYFDSNGELRNVEDIEQ